LVLQADSGSEQRPRVIQLRRGSLDGNGHSDGPASTSNSRQAVEPPLSRTPMQECSRRALVLGKYTVLAVWQCMKQCLEVGRYVHGRF
jgi:hypothetical protein